jgi:anti-sigma regulatory factor (Ser/Thr protein kinase)
MLRELVLHILDLAENSMAAGATRVTIDVIEEARADRLTIRVADNGRGMEADHAARVADPFVTSRTTRRVGLGLPFLKQAAELCNGALTIDSAQGVGTIVTATFRSSHIDRMPMGDLPGTILTLVVGNPQVDFAYRHVVNDKTFEFDTRPIKKELGEVALSEPSVIGYLKDALKEI